MTGNRSLILNGRMKRNVLSKALLVLALAPLAFGCRQDMHDQPRFEPLEANPFFADDRASRPLLPGTIPRGHLKLDTHLYFGKVDGALVTTFPFPVTEAVLKRGRERYDIYCSPCHGYLGYGDGMIVKRGFKAPPSLHSERLRNEPVGHLYDVITNGLGAMYDYADRIKPRDRWAIVAYIKTLQFSQHVPFEELPEENRQRLVEEVE